MTNYNFNLKLSSVKRYMSKLKADILNLYPIPYNKDTYPKTKEQINNTIYSIYTEHILNNQPYILTEDLPVFIEYNRDILTKEQNKYIDNKLDIIYNPFKPKYNKKNEHHTFNPGNFGLTHTTSKTKPKPISTTNPFDIPNTTIPNTLDKTTLLNLFKNKTLIINDTPTLPALQSLSHLFSNTPKNKTLIQLLHTLKSCPLLYIPNKLSNNDLISKCAFSIEILFYYKDYSNLLPDNNPNNQTGNHIDSILFIENWSYINLLNQVIKIISNEISALNKMKDSDLYIPKQQLNYEQTLNSIHINFLNISKTKKEIFDL